MNPKNLNPRRPSIAAIPLFYEDFNGVDLAISKDCPATSRKIGPLHGPLTLLNLGRLRHNSCHNDVALAEFDYFTGF
jgi:hypothetical protein